MKTTAAAIMLSTTLGTALMRSSLGFFVGPTIGRSMAGTTATASTSSFPHHLFNRLFSSSATTGNYPIMAEEDVMSKKKHGTSDKPVQEKLRWNCDYETAE